MTDNPTEPDGDPLLPASIVHKLILKAQAAAWAEGYAKRASDGPPRPNSPTPPNNPYR